MDLVYFLRVLQRPHPYHFSDVDLRISNMSTETASKNGRTKRFEYMTSVLITRPEWADPIESLLTSFKEGGLVDYPSSRSQESKRKWYVFCVGICNPSQPFHGYFDLGAIMNQPKTRYGVKSKVLEILKALHELAEKKRENHQDLSENERLGSKLHTTFNKNLASEKSSIVEKKEESAKLAEKLNQASQKMHLNPPSPIIDLCNGSKVTSPPSIERISSPKSGFAQGRQDGAKSRKIKSCSSSSLHFGTSEKDLTRPTRDETGYAGHAAKRRGLDRIEDLDKSSKAILEGQQVLFPLVANYFARVMPDGKEIQEKKLLDKLGNLVKRHESLVAVGSQDTDIAKRLVDEILAINLQLEDYK